MRLLLIVNTFASSVTARGQVVIARALGAGHDLQVVETHRRNHATRFAQDAAARGVDVVVVLGGDGTVNEAANGLAGTECALAALPGGSTNVFARAIGLPNDPVEATAVLADSLSAGSVRRVGLGSVNGRRFLFHTGIGFDARVVREVERSASLKRWAGHPLFAVAAARTWMATDRRQPAFAVHHDDGSVVDGVFSICLNTDPYTFLGNRPFHVTDAASLDRGLVMVTFTDLRSLTMVRALSGALGGRGLKDGRHVKVRTDLSRVTVAGHPAVPYQVDGDDLGDAERLEFVHVPDALSLVVPRPDR